MFRFAQSLRMPWWNYSTEQRLGKVLQAGGIVLPKVQNSRHKIYVKKYRRGHFPNRGRTHLNVTMNGTVRQRPRRMGWPYDINTLIFNSQHGTDKIGYVVSTGMLKTAVVAANYMVYYPKYTQKVARTGRYFAHDEDMSCVEGDLVHIRRCRKMAKYKHYYIFSILEPNIEGRERLKLGLKVRPPDLFGYPSTRRIMKINLTAKSHTKETVASAMQEQVAQFYKFGGQVAASPVLKGTDETSNVTFDDAHRVVAPLAEKSQMSSITSDEDSSESPHALGGISDMDYTELEVDMRRRKGDEYWSRQSRGAADKFNLGEKGP